MNASHYEILVEEPSMEAFLQQVLPKLIPDGTTFQIYHFQCKSDLLQKLSSRLNGYSKWLPRGWRIVVLVDCDDDDCKKLKRRIETMASKNHLRTRKHSPGQDWQVANRIVMEELEAWYFGDIQAVRAAYPRFPANITGKRIYRNPDAISGGTWETFERLMQKVGYFEQGLRKIEAAHEIGKYIKPNLNLSSSFKTFCNVFA